ncbi:MAG: hypothetical protein ABSG98_02970 [Anaerolineales bacterium]
MNGFSFLPVIAALGLMSLSPASAWRSQSSPARDLREGVGYVASHATVLVLVVVSGVTALLGQGCMIVLPAWSVEVLHAGWVVSSAPC